MDLIEDIKIFGLNKEMAQKRIWMSTGLQLADEPVDGFDYEDNTFKFKKPWRRATETELDKLLTLEKTPEYANTIGIVKVPNDLRELIENLGIPNLKSEKEFVALRGTKPREYLKVMDALYHYKKGYLIKEEMFHKLKMAFFRWGWHTLALDIYGSKKFCGMHFDQWDALPLNQSHLASNRMCVNLGTEARSFVFVNLSAESIYQMVDDPGFDKSSRCQEELTFAFYNKFPDYPVTRIELEPFEAYIAPTENIIHDGSTEEMSDIDIHITTRGFFNVFEQPALVENE